MSEILKKRGNPGEIAVVPPRERILAAARELFCAHGIRGVSVDEIAAQAETNKMTLYRHFESKDQLVAEHLRVFAREAEEVWDVAARKHAHDPMAQLHAWVDYIASHLADERGCPIANAAVELPEKDHPARAVIEEHKNGQREQLVSHCRQAGFAEPERVADEIFLMLEGARVNIQSVGTCGPGGRFPEMVNALMKAHPRAV